MKKQLGLKCLICAILSAPLALFICGIYGWLGPGNLVDGYMVVLWLLVPVWTTIFCITIKFKSLPFITTALIVLNIAAFGALILARTPIN